MMCDVPPIRKNMVSYSWWRAIKERKVTSLYDTVAVTVTLALSRLFTNHHLHGMHLRHLDFRYAVSPYPSHTERAM